MDSLSQLSTYLVQYGYLAIFILVFLQQIGVPNPVTNELVLIFCGYLSYSGTLNIYESIIVAVSADFLGSMLLFFLFSFFGKWLSEHSPKWFPLSQEKIEKMKSRVSSNGQRGLFIGRMTPIIRGYVSVVAGTLNIGRKAFMGTVLISALLWNGLLVLIGLIIGPYWKVMINKGSMVQNILLLVLFIVGIIFIGRYFQRRQLVEEKKEK
jgi:membrane protein DedA with SNARE-associated domain